MNKNEHKKHKNFSKKDWTKFKNLYQTGQKTLKQIAEDFGVNYLTLRGRASKEKWTANKEEICNNIATKSLQKTAENLSDENAEINRLHIDLATKLINIASGVADSVPVDILKVSEQAAALRALANMLESAQKVHRIALDVGDDYEEPEITIIKGLDINKL